MQPQPVTDELGPQQTAAIVGPDGPTIEQFVCSVCDQKHYDINHYFYGVDSTRCMWCTKYNKQKPKIKTVETVDSKD